MSLALRNNHSSAVQVQAAAAAAAAVEDPPTSTPNHHNSIAASSTATTTNTTRRRPSLKKKVSLLSSSLSQRLSRTTSNSNSSSSHQSRPAQVATAAATATATVTGEVDNDESEATAASDVLVTPATSTTRILVAATAPSPSSVRATSTSALVSSLSNTTNVTTSTTTAATSTAVLPKKKPSFFKSFAATGRPPRFQKKSQSKNNSHKMTSFATSTSTADMNVLQWLEVVCPDELCPRILAYCGPQTTRTLLQTNRYWFDLIAKQDSTWRTLCEGMYKVCHCIFDFDLLFVFNLSIEMITHSRVYNIYIYIFSIISGKKDVTNYLPRPGRNITAFIPVCPLIIPRFHGP